MNLNRERLDKVTCLSIKWACVSTRLIFFYLFKKKCASRYLAVCVVCIVATEKSDGCWFACSYRNVILRCFDSSLKYVDEYFLASFKSDFYWKVNWIEHIYVNQKLFVRNLKFCVCALFVTRRVEVFDKWINNPKITITVEALNLTAQIFCPACDARSDVFSPNRTFDQGNNLIIEIIIIKLIFIIKKFNCHRKKLEAINDNKFKWSKHKRIYIKHYGQASTP